jgi:pyruvate dehydrogenase E1 component alpha subunit
LSFLQILDEEGNLDAALDPQLSEQQLVTLYRSMVLAREADGRMLKMQRQGRLGTFPPCTGQEAAVCGAALAMGEQDWLVGSYRELGARLMRGEPLDATLQYYNGYEEGSAQCMENRILPTQVILGSQVPHAVGLAYAARYRGEQETAVVAFFGDGASSQGDVHEAMNFAGVWQVPVVFICQNNGWAISVPRSTQSRAETIAQRAFGYGFSGVQVDGNDALAVYRATSEALARARAGEGPTLIEAITYRLMMHTTADDPKKYRSEEEERTWWKRDPIPRLRSYMERRGIWDEDREQGLAGQVKNEVGEAVQRLEAADPGAFKPDAPFDHVLGTRHEELERQRADFLAHVQRVSTEGGDG